MMVIQPIADLAAVGGPRPVPDFADEATRHRLTPTAITAFLQIAEHWGLSAEIAGHLLGDVAVRTWYRLKKGEWPGTLSQDQMMRASAALGIFKGLRLLFVGELADQWIRLPNKREPFNGLSPLDYMIRGGIPALLDVRQHVDALRGGL
jgi:hypothetical protein